MNDINFNISGLRGEISEMASMLDWKLTMLIEEQRVTNQLLGHISKLLRIPDSQKQRIYHIEQGLKYLKNALIEGSKSSFYDDSLEGFKEAEKIEKKDYITLKRLGQVYLYSEKHLNIPLSEEYFIKSGREALAEANAGGTTTSKHFRPSDSDTGIYSENLFLAEAAEAYLYAGRTCYLQQKLTEAIEYAGKAFNLVPELIEAGFEQAKYLAANNQENEAVKVLETVIEKDRFFSIKTMNDQDLSTKPAVLKLLGRFQQKAIEKAKIRVGECKDIMNRKSNAGNLLGEIEILISKNSFLSGMKALDLLSTTHTLPFKTRVDRVISGYDSDYTIKEEGKISPPQTVLNFIKCENENFEEFNKRAKDSIKYQKKDATKTGAFWGCLIGFTIGLFYGFTLESFSMVWGPLFLSLIVCGGIGAVIGYLAMSGLDYNIEETYWK